jgi:hypothetical protein
MDIWWHQDFISIFHDDKHLVRVGVAPTFVDTNKSQLVGQISPDQELQNFLTMGAEIAVIKYILFARHWINKI